VSSPAWPRPHWRDSGEQAFLLWFVFGRFDDGLRIDAQRYRTRGLPEGIEAIRYVHAALERWDGYPLAGTLGRLLWEEDARLFERARKAPECWMLRGALPDPSDLDPLRDVVGSIAALCDGGGVAVLDPQTLSMTSAAQWRRDWARADAFAARDHLLILCSDDDRSPGRQWVHTRGLRKFARPDIGVRNVPPAHADAAGELAERFAQFQCAGGIVPDGHVIEIAGCPAPMTIALVGGPDDPEFNNRHLALRWPD
jgi:hypothetical protein